MSLILDALNRSRQDADPVPGLGTHHPVAQTTGAVRQYLPWLALSVALLLIGWLLWERGDDAPADGATSINAPVAELSRNIGSAVTAATTELKARTAQAPAASNLPAASAPAATTITASQSALPESSTTVPGMPLENVAQASPALESELQAFEPSAAIRENAAVAQLYQKQEQSPVAAERPAPKPAAPAAVQNKRSSVVQQQEQEQPLDIGMILRKAQEEVDNARLEEHPTPFLADLSQQTKDSVPTIYYQRHDYSAQAGQSSVVLNGKTLKAGGSPGAGFKVEEILSGSVVLSYRGTQFRLRALNSWINL